MVMMYVSDLFHLLHKINRVCLHDQIKFAKDRNADKTDGTDFD